MNNESPIILVVDDNPANLAILVDLLDEKGFDVLTAKDGDSGIKRAEIARPDLILLDILMPGIDGFETCRRLKGSEKTKNIPVIFITAMTDTTDKVRGFALGAVDYIPKPIQPDEVLARVNTHLTIQQLQNTLREKNAELQEALRNEREAREELIEKALETRRAQLAALESKKAKEAAEAASYAKAVFLTNVGHELRTPLNGVLGFAPVLRRDPTLSVEQKSKVESIERSGNRLLKLIREILETVSLETKKMELHESDVQLPELLITIAQTARVQAQHKGLTFYYEAAPDIPIVIYSDEDRLRHVLFSLLDNAIKYTEQGRVTFRVTKVEDDDLKSQISNLKSQIHFRIEDTGIGIPEDQLESIFLPFKQVAEYLQKKDGGVGLGLFISRSLVRLMGGELHVKSTPGEGSVFWFNLELPVIAACTDFPQ